MFVCKARQKYAIRKKIWAKVNVACHVLPPALHPIASNFNEPIRTNKREAAHGPKEGSEFRIERLYILIPKLAASFLINKLKVANFRGQNGGVGGGGVGGGWQRMSSWRFGF